MPFIELVMLAQGRADVDTPLWSVGTTMMPCLPTAIPSHLLCFTRTAARRESVWRYGTKYEVGWPWSSSEVRSAAEVVGEPRAFETPSGSRFLTNICS